MKEVLQGFIGALFDFIDGDGIVRQTINSESYKAKITVNDELFRMIISKSQLDSDHNEDSDSNTENEEIVTRKEKQAQCTQIRNEFHQYINNLDKSLFTAICKSFDSEDLVRLNTSVEINNTDPDLMNEAIEIFKAAADKVIMDKVSKLKSQMTNFPH